MLAVLNPAYKEEELEFALRAVGLHPLAVWDLIVEVKVFITTPKLNNRSHIPLLEHLVPSLNLASSSPLIPSLKHIIIINNCGAIPSELSKFIPFNEIPTNYLDLSTIQKELSEHDVVNLQFTSGTTGSPKAAMLTHQYLPSGNPFLIKVTSSIMESLSVIT